jgi:amino acid adenylation domain-containing protein
MAGSIENRFETLSKEKQELLKLLLEKESRQAQRIRPYPRAVVADQVRAPASWAQQRLWFIDLLEQGTAAYNVSTALRLSGSLDEAALEDALNALVQRHEVLRTTFDSVDGEPLQIIAADSGFRLQHVDLSGLEQDARDSALAVYKNEEAQAPFSLAKGPLIRGRLIRLEPELHVLLITMHHIVSDVWSMGVFLRELAALYGARREGEPSPLRPLAIQYADYAQWQREWLKGPVLEKQLAYWRDRLDGAPPVLELPADRPRPDVQSFRGERFSVTFDPALVASLQSFARDHQITLFMLAYAAWSILLSRLSGQDDILVGTPIANRQRPELESLIGFLVNTLVLRTSVQGHQSVAEFLAEVRKDTLAAYDHQDLPFEQVVEALQPQRSLAHHSIFQVMFGLQNAPAGVLKLKGLESAEDEEVNAFSKFDLLVLMEERESTLRASVHFAAALFDRATVERWMACYVRLLGEIIRDPVTRIQDLRILTNEQRRRVVHELNDTRIPFPSGKTIHGLFEEQVARAPDAEALVHAEQRLTYSQLDRAANQLARYLAKRGVGPDQLAGVCIGRSAEMVIALLAILKAGGGYLPLDPRYPSERLKYMIEHAAPRLVITQRALCSMLPRSDAEIIDIDDALREADTESDSALDAAGPRHDASNLLYVIYTSGSTGQPKGTAMPHRAMANLIEWHRRELPSAEGQRVLQFAALSFDVAFQEVFSTLCTGSSIVMIDEWVRRDSRALAEFLGSAGIRRLFLPPLMLQSLAECCRAMDLYPTALRDVITAGEQLRISPEIRAFFDSIPGCRLHNHYGPTETHVVTALTLAGPAQSWPGLPTIGRPIANTQIYVLDPGGEPVPAGVAGEIFIGGANVARGYLRRPELTAERFVRDPFSTDERARLYKTGDLGRWRADGTVEYLGRNDDQVKIRGFRVELAEVEARLALHPKVREAAVVAREDRPGEKRLVAYVTLRDQRPAPDELRTHLKEGLPEFMVPAAFVVLDALPLTPSGKLNRRLLPAPDPTAVNTPHFEKPRGETEELLARLWQDLLQVDRVGRQDNFFSLGGHSLLIVRMMENLRKAGFSVDVRAIYASPTLSDLARTLKGGATPDADGSLARIPLGCEQITHDMLDLVSLEPEHLQRIVDAVPGGSPNVQDVYPLLPLQQGMLFHYLLGRQSHGDAYVRPMLMSLPSRARVDDLIRALQKVIDRHDALRTAVLWEHLPEPVQVVYRRAELPVEFVTPEPAGDARAQLEARMSTIGAQLDLRQAPLLRLQVSVDPQGTWYALIQTHHLVFDNESRQVMLDEVMAELAGKEIAHLAPTPYRNHVARALKQARAADSETFFRQKLGDVTDPTAVFGVQELQSDGSDPAEHRSEFGPQLSSRIRDHARNLGVSAATFFHAAWALVAACTSGRDDVVFGTVLLGRMGGGADTRGTLGMFINTLPLRLTLRNTSARDLVVRTQGELAGLLSHEQASLADIQRCSGLATSLPLFSSILNFRQESEEPVAFPETSGISVLASPGSTNYPVAISVVDRQARFLIEAQTDRRIEPRRLLQYLQTVMVSLLDALEKAPEKPVLSLAFLPKGEREQVLEGFNATRTEFPRDSLIHSLFEDQVARAPGAIALLDDSESLTYAELNVRANQLAHYLLAQGVKPGENVALLMERSVQSVIVQLAVLKSGGAYVPIDPRLPPERQHMMLKDCGTRLLLADVSLPAEVPLDGIRFVALADALRVGAGLGNENPNVSVHAMSAAYIMYTSGSTGTPKGVVVPHRGVNRLIVNNGYAEIRPSDCISHSSNPAFDAATFEIWAALLSGARLLVIPHESVLDARRYEELLRKHEVTILWMTVGLFNQYADVLSDVFSRVRYLITGGDIVDPGIALRILERDRPGNLLNAYGPTEGTTFTTLCRLNGSMPLTEPLPIGRPMSNTCVRILNSQLQPVPVGAVGEIYIGGDGVAVGYLNRPELTAERFIRDPFSSDSDARLYKSGDLGRWRADGNIDFLGRNDQQVKLRGFRVELGEIEAQLLRHPRVGGAVVVVRQDGPGNKRLVAYVTARDRNSLDAGELRAHMQGGLPEYMIPAAFVTLDALPLNGSGKIDRRALPEPRAEAYANREFEPPAGEVEESLAAIWTDLLGVDRVGREDHFFELGGHSLHVIRLISRVTDRLGVDMVVPDVFRHPTLRGMADRIAVRLRALQPRTPEALESDDSEGSALIPLTFSQRAHWNWYSLGERRHILQVPSATHIRGKLDVGALRASIAELVRRHDALRVRIVVRDGSPMQRVDAAGTCELSTEDLSDVPESERDECIRRRVDEVILTPTDVLKDPLFRFHLLRLSGDEHVLIVAMEHIISDMYSMNVLLRELLFAYSQIVTSGSVSWAPLGINGAEHARSELESSAAWERKNGEYWRGRLEKCSRVRFPSDVSRDDPRHSAVGWGTAAQTIDSSLKSELLTWCRSNGTTPTLAVFSAYAALVLRWCDTDDAVFRYVTDGRPSPKLQNTIGYFAGGLPLRLELRNTDNFLDFLRRATDEYCKAYEHADFGRIDSRVPQPDFVRNSTFNWIPLGSREDAFGLAESQQLLKCTAFPFEHPMMARFERDAEPGVLFYDSRDEVAIRMHYPRARISAESMDRFGRNLLFSIRQLCRNPNQRLREIERVP